MTRSLFPHDFELRLDPFVAHDAVLFIEDKNPRLMFSRFFGRVTPEIHDRNAVANFAEMRGCTIKLDQPLVRLTINDISLEPFAVI